VANGERLRVAMVAAKGAVQTHLLAHGGHGFRAGIGPGSPDGFWLPLSFKFARGQKLLV